jgi:hypothetical protein
MTGYAVRLEQAVRQRMDVLPKPCSPTMLAEALTKAMARGQTPRPPPQQAAPMSQASNGV